MGSMLTGADASVPEFYKRGEMLGLLKHSKMKHEKTKVGSKKSDINRHAFRGVSKNLVGKRTMIGAQDHHETERMIGATAEGHQEAEEGKMIGANDHHETERRTVTGASGQGIGEGELVGTNDYGTEGRTMNGASDQGIGEGEVAGVNDHGTEGRTMTGASGQEIEEGEVAGANVHGTEVRTMTGASGQEIEEGEVAGSNDPETEGRTMTGANDDHETERITMTGASGQEIENGGAKDHETERRTTIGQRDDSVDETGNIDSGEHDTPEDTLIGAIDHETGKRMMIATGHRKTGFHSKTYVPNPVIDAKDIEHLLHEVLRQESVRPVKKSWYPRRRLEDLSSYKINRQQPIRRLEIRNENGEGRSKISNDDKDDTDEKGSVLQSLLNPNEASDKIEANVRSEAGGGNTGITKNEAGDKVISELIKNIAEEVDGNKSALDEYLDLIKSRSHQNQNFIQQEPGLSEVVHRKNFAHKLYKKHRIP